MNKGTVFSIFVALLGFLFVNYSVFEFFDYDKKTNGMIFLLVGLAALYAGIKLDLFQRSNQLGLMIGGAVLVIESIIFLWDYFPDGSQVFVLGGLLVGAIYFGNKYSRYLK